MIKYNPKDVSINYELYCSRTVFSHVLKQSAYDKARLDEDPQWTPQSNSLPQASIKMPSRNHRGPIVANAPVRRNQRSR